MIKKVDRELFDYHWEKNPKGGIYKAIELLLNKVDELIEEQNRLVDTSQKEST